MERQERRGTHPDGDLPDPPRFEKERPDSAHDTIADREVRRPLAWPAQHDQLVLEQEILRDPSRTPPGPLQSSPNSAVDLPLG